jgi:hypothetical protein
MTPPPSLRRIRDDDELLDVLGGRLADPADELSAVLGDWARSIDTDMAIPPSLASARATRRRALRRRGLRGAAVVAVFGLTLSGTGVAAAVTDTHLPVLGRLATVTQRLLPHDFHGGTGPALSSEHVVEPGGAVPTGPATSDAVTVHGGTSSDGTRRDGTGRDSSVAGDQPAAGRQGSQDRAGGGADGEAGSGRAPAAPVVPPVSPSLSDPSALPTPSTTTPVPGESVTTPPPPTTASTSPGTTSAGTTTPPPAGSTTTTSSRPTATPNPSRTTASPATSEPTASSLVAGPSPSVSSADSADPTLQSGQLDQTLPVKRTSQALDPVATSLWEPVLGRHDLSERRFARLVDPPHGLRSTRLASAPASVQENGWPAEVSTALNGAKATNPAPAREGAGSRQAGQ